MSLSLVNISNIPFMRRDCQLVLKMIYYGWFDSRPTTNDIINSTNIC